MKAWSSPFVFALLAAVAGCQQPLTAGVADSDPQAVGQLQVALTGVDSRMQLYRLRGAVFDINGTRYTDFQPVMESVESDDDPDAELLRARLFYGSYGITLRDTEWYLERVGAEGTQRVEQAVLLSPPAQSFFLQQQGTARVAYQFGVDGELIDFYGGDLEIEIGIQNAPDAGTAGEPG